MFNDHQGNISGVLLTSELLAAGRGCGDDVLVCEDHPLGPLIAGHHGGVADEGGGGGGGGPGVLGPPRPPLLHIREPHNPDIVLSCQGLDVGPPDLSYGDDHLDVGNFKDSRIPES